MVVTSSTRNPNPILTSNVTPDSQAGTSKLWRAGRIILHRETGSYEQNPAVTIKPGANPAYIALAAALRNDCNATLEIFDM